MYHFRHIEEKLKLAGSHFKVILLLGARQVGKSTLFTHIFPDIKAFVFDPVQDLYGVRKDPDLFLDNFPGPLILDEIQYVPELLPSIKRKVDKSDLPGQYFLTGSQNLSILKSVSESLAGRVGIFVLENMTFHEIKNIVNPEKKEQTWLDIYIEDPYKLPDYFEQITLEQDSLFDFLYKGTLPGTLTLPDNMLADYFSSYIQTYIERDVR
ncbi:AAA family ATPase, partial [bacterium]|nr:AAA family ATPase [bacterium]